MPLYWNDGLWNEGLWNADDTYTSSFRRTHFMVCDTDYKRQAFIKHVIEAKKTEELQGEYSISFKAILTSTIADLITEDSIFEIDNDYFDIVYLKKSATEDGAFYIEVEAEHISYRLNDIENNVLYFTKYGTPEYILGEILTDTEFTVGTVELTELTTYSAQEEKSRRQLLLEFVYLIGGDLSYDKKQINILSHRGNSTPTMLMNGKNIQVIEKTINKREKDEEGNPLVSIICTPTNMTSDDFSLGDNVLISQEKIGISRQTLRIIRYEQNPYTKEIVFVISNSLASLEDAIFRIETNALIKNQLYNGIKIGPEYGFEAIRSDLKARAYFRSDGLMFQSGDGTGNPDNWKNRLYYEYDSELDDTILVFDGKMSADVIEAISALVTPNLYAEKASISELTVDSLETSTKVKKYLEEDTSDVNYIRAYGQTIKFITARVSSTFSPVWQDDGSFAGNSEVDTYYTSISLNETLGIVVYSGGSSISLNALTAFNTGFIFRRIDDYSYYRLNNINGDWIEYSIFEVDEQATAEEHVKNAKGEKMYWTDETLVSASTSETEWPVMQYVYNELVKQSISFEYDPVSEQYLPITILGAGTGQTSTSGQGRIQKNTDGVVISYKSSNGTKDATITLNDEGFVDVTARRADIVVDKTEQKITINPEGDATSYDITYDEDGDIITFNWPDGKSFTVEVTE